MKPDLNQFLPLSPAVLHILLALSGEDRHGYAIMQEIARQTEGRYKLGPGTLYDNLEKLLDAGFVLEARRPTHDDDPRRRYYQLSGAGRTLLATEIERLEALVHEAQGNLGLKPRRAT